MGKVAITGAKGKIGSILCQHLSQMAITRLSLPWVDVRRYKQLVRRFRDHSTVIHLAWNSAETIRSLNCCSENTAMFMNVYQAALETKIKRVIMASSVHADDFYGWTNSQLINTNDLPKPKTAYGRHKLFMESLGFHYAQQGLEVVCVRFGGVTKDNLPNAIVPDERAVFLHHDDLVDLIQTIALAPVVPAGFSTIYAVSDTQHRRHDITNPFGWNPPYRELN